MVYQQKSQTISWKPLLQVMYLIWSSVLGTEGLYSYWMKPLVKSDMWTLLPYSMLCEALNNNHKKWSLLYAPYSGIKLSTTWTCGLGWGWYEATFFFNEIINLIFICQQIRLFHLLQVLFVFVIMYEWPGQSYLWAKRAFLWAKRASPPQGLEFLRGP